MSLWRHNQITDIAFDAALLTASLNEQQIIKQVLLTAKPTPISGKMTKMLHPLQKKQEQNEKRPLAYMHSLWWTVHYNVF